MVVRAFADSNCSTAMSYDLIGPHTIKDSKKMVHVPGTLSDWLANWTIGSGVVRTRVRGCPLAISKLTVQVPGTAAVHAITSHKDLLSLRFTVTRNYCKVKYHTVIH
jgi:hypothetical protein